MCNKLLLLLLFLLTTVPLSHGLANSTSKTVDPNRKPISGRYFEQTGGKGRDCKASDIKGNWHKYRVNIENKAANGLPDSSHDLVWKNQVILFDKAKKRIAFASRDDNAPIPQSMLKSLPGDLKKSPDAYGVAYDFGVINLGSNLYLHNQQDEGANFLCLKLEEAPKKFTESKSGDILLLHLERDKAYPDQPDKVKIIYTVFLASVNLASPPKELPKVRIYE